MIKKINVPAIRKIKIISIRTQFGFIGMKVSDVQRCEPDSEIHESGILCIVHLRSQFLLGVIKQIR
jgi:hypothetical protein